MNDCIALVVAAGRGVRAGGGLPKQYRTVAGQPVLRYSLELFGRHPRVGAVRTVIHPDDRALYDAAAHGLDVLDPVPGGATRQDSVRLGLESLSGTAPRFVLIHDAARPFVGPEIIDRTLDALGAALGAIPAVAVADTLKRGSGGAITGTVDRTALWRAQTPQGFRYPEILAAHRAAAGAELSDDAAVAERAGLPVALVAGSEANVKLTTEEDFVRAELFAGGDSETRVATGFDVHKFGPGDHVWLGGVRVPHTHGLIGHSDADVALHALTDALLGTIGAGDIGMHFPPSDPQWRGVESRRFLAHAADLVAKRGGRIQSVDVTVICERPKVGPHRPAIVAKLAEILGIAAERCSVKATTTEGLGFTGRSEGIAAQAVATVRLPALR
jgi:2-C-methyl-D-erythritol 4-phosphate cytidylyltransferase/2-C-methyl-D-erythritol 2,4-cyclodiphosphate synthase